MDKLRSWQLTGLDPSREVTPAELLAARFWGKVDKSAGEDACWTMNTRGGYPYFMVGKHNKRAARVSYELYIGPIPSGLWVCHHCDNPPCVNPAHLFLGNSSKNQIDCRDKGRLGARAKLRPGQAAEIRRRYPSGGTLKEIGEDFGITESAVSRVVNGSRWGGT